MMDVESYQTLQTAKEKAEEVQAMFGGINAVLSAAEDSVNDSLIDPPLEGGIKAYVEYNGRHLRELIGVIEHLLWEMSDAQDALVHLLAQKTFATRKELEAATATVSGAKDG